MSMVNVVAKGIYRKPIGSTSTLRYNPKAWFGFGPRMVRGCPGQPIGSGNYYKRISCYIDVTL